MTAITETLDIARTLLQVRQGLAPEFGSAAPTQPYRPEHGIRVAHSGATLAGYTDLVRFSDDFYLVISDTTMTRDFQASYVTSAWVGIHFRLSGESRMLLDDGVNVERAMARCHVACYPEGFVKTEIGRSRSPSYQYVAILMRPWLLREQFASHVNELPLRFRRYLHGSHQEFYFQSISFSRDMQRALRDIIDTQMERDVRWIFARAKALELVCRVIEALPRRTADEANEMHFKPRDVELLNEARIFIESNLARHCTIQEIARQVGLNRRKLTAGFTKFFGATVFEFGQQLRMERAVELLREDQLNISAIASQLGYDNPRNFSVAFAGHYGILPKDFRAKARCSPRTVIDAARR